MNPTSIEFICRVVIIFLAVGIHEYAHCKFADLAGDPTPRYYGRVTLNLFKHFEPTGTIMMVVSSLIGFGLGWGRPAPMDPSKMANPRWDFFIAVAAGPLSNLAQAFIFGSVFRVMVGTPLFYSNPFLSTLILSGVIINISLFLFNLIPFGPLDGHYLLGLLMPEKMRIRWFMFNQKVGIPGLFAVILLLQFSAINLVTQPIFKLTSLIIGHPI